MKLPRSGSPLSGSFMPKRSSPLASDSARTSQQAAHPPASSRSDQGQPARNQAGFQPPKRKTTQPPMDERRMVAHKAIHPDKFEILKELEQDVLDLNTHLHDFGQMKSALEGQRLANPSPQLEEKLMCVKESISETKEELKWAHTDLALLHSGKYRTQDEAFAFGRKTKARLARPSPTTDLDVPEGKKLREAPRQTFGQLPESTPDSRKKTVHGPAPTEAEREAGLRKLAAARIPTQAQLADLHRSKSTDLQSTLNQLQFLHAERAELEAILKSPCEPAVRSQAEWKFNANGNRILQAEDIKSRIEADLHKLRSRFEAIQKTLPSNP